MHDDALHNFNIASRLVKTPTKCPSLQRLVRRHALSTKKQGLHGSNPDPQLQPFPVHQSKPVRQAKATAATPPRLIRNPLLPKASCLDYGRLQLRLNLPRSLKSLEKTVKYPPYQERLLWTTQRAQSLRIARKRPE